MRRLRFLAIVPSSGSSRPASRLSNVDLPAPLGPTSPIRSCSSIWKLTPAKTRSAPNDFPTCMALTMGIYLSYYDCCKLFLDKSNQRPGKKLHLHLLGPGSRSYTCFCGIVLLLLHRSMRLKTLSSKESSRAI